MKYTLTIKNKNNEIVNAFKSDNELKVFKELTKVYGMYFDYKNKHNFTIDRFKITRTSNTLCGAKTIKATIKFNEKGFYNTYEYEFVGVEE